MTPKPPGICQRDGCKKKTKLGDFGIRKPYCSRECYKATGRTIFNNRTKLK